MKLLKPDKSIEKVEDISLERLKEYGIKGIILDLDNTIVPWGEYQPKEGIVKFVEKAKDLGFKLCIVSNAPRDRVKKAGEVLGLQGIWYAKKPFPFSLKKAYRELLNLPPKEVALVGDQIFTDILGGNLVGFYTIMVEPITKKDFIGTKIFRTLEKRLHLR